ncbi:tyrosine-type recombinase/integrase [Acetobacter musti]|uniref:Tyrosine-type recombinase/integrase n=1 Tax=Acetobacter musti TaxID=864732 RepID=A0ABX0JNK2_9PROT|nr:tyrosine-type recombinase/integrase [Acetobacter musti]NHN83632.1 tyrosine-type recombinase/integrase [Acetobacter musti]
MPPSRRTGLNVVTKKRPDGTTLRYFYERSTGRFLGHDREGAERYVRGDAADCEAGIVPGSIGWLIVDYLRDAEAFGTLALRTRRLYRGYLDRMREDWGDIPPQAVTRDEVKQIRQRLAATPRKANQVLSLLQILLARAKEKGLVSENVAENFGRYPTRKRTEIWTFDMEDQFVARARPTLQLAYLLLLYTIQRPSDMLQMEAGAISERDGRMFIALRQDKTGALIDVPVHQRLAPYIRARLAEIDTARSAEEYLIAGRIGRRTADLLVPSPRGKIWSLRNFSRAWDAVMHRLALSHARTLFRSGMTKGEVLDELKGMHRQRRDLRRTGIVRLAEAGATTPQIAAISGHSIDYCQRIIDTYLPRRTEVAVSGMEAWERHQTREVSKIVSIAASRGRLM